MFAFQTSIGWKNFFRGHVASVFQEFYELTDCHQDHWTFKLIKFIWGQIKELWDVRNSYEHGTDVIQQKHKRHQKLLKELRKVYDDKSTVLAKDRGLFYESAEVHLDNHPQISQVRTWINMVKPTIRKSKQAFLEAATSGMKSVTSYFTSAPAENSSKRIHKRRKSRPSQAQRKTLQHQTYIYFRPNTSLSTRCLPDRVNRTLTPRQIQPQIPWETPPHNQTSITKYFCL